MRKVLGFTMAVLSLSSFVQAAPPALSARILYSQHLETPDGMTKTVTFEERLIRTPECTWQERILSEPIPHEHEHPGPSGEEDHLHPKDLALAARYLRKSEAGDLRLEFVHPNGIRIHAEVRDFPEVGFDGSWAAACHLLDPARFASMKRMARKGPKGTVWYGVEDGHQFLRVLWSPRLELPLRIEAGSENGHKLNITEVRPAPLPKDLPWDHLNGMVEKEYTDLLD